MKKNICLLLICTLALLAIYTPGQAQATVKNSDEMYRPRVHFTPAAHWMNDPNGMVFYKGVYHLFFQYHPYSSVWGPMHWGHATSKDLVHWQRLPIGIYPDSNGTIFSGSAVVDKNNTSGFGKNGRPPLVAIYTQHNMEGEKAGRNDYQTQSIAYSSDEGKTWVKYKANPVIKNPGTKDFRDPKVMWYEPQKKWVMSLSVKDFIAFYSSPDLKNWRKESEFGAGRGAHGGGWECPDLFSLDDNGTQRWVLIANLNPGGPNGGSGTQYFIGDFDGKTFSSTQKETRWLDYGPDDYAGITWSNTGKRKIFLGWMSNWIYANLVPTETFRNAMTIPRELKIKHVGSQIFVASEPVAELAAFELRPVVIKNIVVKKRFNLFEKNGLVKFPMRFNLSIETATDFSLALSNNVGDTLLVGYDKQNNQYFIDRTKSGKTAFNKDFAARHIAPRLITTPKMNINLLIDVSAVELFADDGLTVMTSVFFPNKPYNKINILAPQNMLIKKLEYAGLPGIW